MRAVEDITEQIRAELRAGRLTPGQRLPPERELATQLNVSRSTIREAMSMLEVAGIVERRIGSAGGSFITTSNSAVVARSISDGITLGRYSLAHLAEARLALESFTARRACEIGKDTEFDELERALDRTARIPDENWDQKLEAYRQFLEVFFGMAHNPLLYELAQPLIQKTADVARQLRSSGNDGILKIRRQLVAALRARDPDAAARAIQEAIDFIYAGWLTRSGAGSAR